MAASDRLPLEGAERQSEHGGAEKLRGSRRNRSAVGLHVAAERIEMIQHGPLRDIAEAPKGSRSRQLACTFDISMVRQSLRRKGRIAGC
ncbi:hypothetical protein [Mesorhizobium sp.]|uniref:hypothetical protein n=1 Tax=Mesorhizobium sp. TaxID=1871066 RepID=UPI0025B80F35|nr:hypothetical protein [Mesorhizobium sp.]